MLHTATVVRRIQLSSTLVVQQAGCGCAAAAKRQRCIQFVCGGSGGGGGGVQGRGSAVQWQCQCIAGSGVCCMQHGSRCKCRRCAERQRQFGAACAAAAGCAAQRCRRRCRCICFRCCLCCHKLMTLAATTVSFAYPCRTRSVAHLCCCRCSGQRRQLSQFHALHDALKNTCNTRSLLSERTVVSCNV